MKQIAGKLRLDIAQYREAAAFLAFGEDALDDTVLDTLNKGRMLMAVLKQPMFKYLTLPQEIIILYAALNNYFDSFGSRVLEIYCFKRLITVLLTFDKTAFFNTELLLEIIYDGSGGFTFGMFTEEAHSFLVATKNIMKSINNIALLTF